MKKIIILYSLFLLTSVIYANDGSYYVSGNQLIPIVETDISVMKEILKITRKNKEQVEVSVYYEFHNPGKYKSVVVGFEAFSPGGDVDPEPKNGEHPNIDGFTVNMNNTLLPYKVAIVQDSVYYRNGKFKTLTRTQMEESMADYGWQSADFFYVYHFEAGFKTGLNIIEHTYTCQLSTSVDFIYSFDYVLTAAMRWANKQIDDFTLIVDMGEFQDFYIADPAFGKSPQWKLNGEGINHTQDFHIDFSTFQPREITYTRFAMRRGAIELNMKNFKPKEELHIRSFNPLAYKMPSPFNCHEFTDLPYNLTHYSYYTIPTYDDASRKVLRNYPFARRGYIFSSSELKGYYSSVPWYKPDPNYKAVLSELPKEEQEFVMRYPN